MKILYVTSHVPYPPVKGYLTIALHRMQELRRRGHEVHLLCYDHGRQDEEGFSHLAGVADTVTRVRDRRIYRAFRLCVALFKPAQPLQTALYTSPRMRRTLRRRCAEIGADVVDVMLIRMAQNARGLSGCVTVLDLVDVMTINLERRREHERNLLTRFLLSVEIRRLKRYEPRIVDDFDASVLVSAEEVRHFPDTASVTAIPLFTRSFAPADVEPTPHTIIYFGNLCYFPNIDAIRWFISDCFPRLRALVPDAKLNIAGPNAPDDIRETDGTDGVRYLGFVDDIAPTVRGSACCIAPMRTGTGMQTKVLETMALGVPVVSTPFGVRGLEVSDGVDCLIADGAEDFAARCAEVLSDHELRHRIGRAGAAYVAGRHSLETHVSSVEQLYLQLLKARDG